MKVKAVIFDLDGVLTDTAEFHFIAWRQLSEKLGVYFDHHDNEKLKGVDRLGSLHYILDKGKLKFSEQKINELLDEKNTHYLTLINGINPNYVFNGVLSNFEILKVQGIKLGLASASKNAALVIEKLGITNEFDFIGDAAKVSHSKPAPDIFLAVAEGLGVKPEACIGVEDAVAGVKAIKSAGMYAVGIGDRQVLQLADRVFPTMSSLDLRSVLF